LTRKFETKLKLELDDIGPFANDLIDHALKSLFREKLLTGIGYANVIEWDIAETTEASYIASKIAEELSNDQREVIAIKHGDNGDGDIGFELRTSGSILADIGIKKEKGIWNIYLERDGGDIHISCIEDLLTILTT